MATRRNSVLHRVTRTSPSIPGNRPVSENPLPANGNHVPDFVDRGMALGYSRESMVALLRQLVRAKADKRARRVTPLGIDRRLQRLCQAVVEAEAVLVLAVSR